PRVRAAFAAQLLQQQPELILHHRLQSLPADVAFGPPVNVVAHGHVIGGNRLAIVPAAPPTRKNQRATSCPAPISAKLPYFVVSRLIWSAFWFVLGISRCILTRLFRNPASRRA